MQSPWERPAVQKPSPRACRPTARARSGQKGQGCSCFSRFRAACHIDSWRVGRQDPTHSASAAAVSGMGWLRALSRRRSRRWLASWRRATWSLAEGTACKCWCRGGISRPFVPLRILPCGGRSNVGSVILLAVCSINVSQASWSIGGITGSTAICTSRLGSSGLEGAITVGTPSGPTREVNVILLMGFLPLPALHPPARRPG
jgi:hypothetical protein